MEEQIEDCISEDLLEEIIDTASEDDESFPFSPVYNGKSKSPSINTEHFASSSLNVQNLAKSNTYKQRRKTVKKCKCRKNIQWTWDNDNKSDYVEILKDNMEVRFNKRYSNGTAVVRCTEPMSNHQYYWEVKMTYPVYGTDVMVGVGTPDATVAYLQDRYVSRLGMDEQTWGFSCHGLFHHNGERKCYAQRFDQGNIIGVHLDLWKGTLSFYKNRKHLGVASSGLKGKTLYAMASSTAACSGMRIVHACCFPSSLQFLCAAKLRELVPDDENVLDVINVPPGLKQFLQTHLSWLLDKPQLEEDFENCCMIDNMDDNEEVEDVSHSDVSSQRIFDHYSAESMFVLIGSVFVNRNQHILNRRAIRNSENSNREDPERDTKRLRTSYYVFDLSEYDSD